MKTINDPRDLQARCLDLRARGQKIALVPTMGYLHQGHLSLIKWARDNADAVVASIFVNPTQFGPNEDLDSYPRSPEKDAELAAKAGVDILFTPDPGKVYSPDHATWVQVPDLAANLCGASRPVHFRGVATVVAKLFNLAQPHLAVFGQKDWQQLALVTRMARDLDFPVKIVGRPIVREADGLALSSRNVRLTREERVQAPELRKGLLAAARLAAKGETDAKVIKQAILDHYAANTPLGRVDYVELVDPVDIVPVETIAGPVLAAVAVAFSKARLIDNMLMDGDAP